MLESADLGQRNDAAVLRWLNGARLGRIFIECEMGARAVIVGSNDMERLAPPGPLVGEPRPEETVEAPQLRALRAAKQDELLSQRQVLEREVSAGSERGTQRA